MFALSGLKNIPPKINLKCDPERAISLREEYDGIITPGFHMNKKHWNTLEITQLPKDFLEDLIAHSYNLLVQSVTKKQREQIKLA
jgi:predicted DNA-binding protein (MmcQ/YjbR family)